jgi:hypothetical protein
MSEPTSMNLNRRYFSIKTHRDGVCKECEVPIFMRESAVWDSVDQELYCVPCGTELMEGDQK